MSHYIKYLEKTLKICDFFLMKFAFQILQKWAEIEGSSALAVWKGFVFVLMFEFSVATTCIYHLSCKSHLKNKCLSISWTYGDTESTWKLQNLKTLCRFRSTTVISNQFSMENSITAQSFAWFRLGQFYYLVTTKESKLSKHDSKLDLCDW